MTVYVAWILGLSLPFILWERRQPRHPSQPTLRPQWWMDVGYAVLNGHLLGLFTSWATMRLMAHPAIGPALHGLHQQRVAALPTWQQFLIVVVVVDFLQWCIHNALHRVPFLWRLHQVHHSIEQLDWIGNWRFHWSEGLIYKSLLYAPIALLGANLQAMGLYAILSTFMGHFNHANLRVSIGPLRYILNSPAMHVWHHTHPDSGPVDRNFGVIFSIWDWLFGTAYLPSATPRRLGFAGIERFPKAMWRQWLIPFAA